MCSTHEVICSICGRMLAWWSMFHNIQKEDEYACSAAIQRDNNEIIVDNVVQDEEHLSELKKLIKEKQLDTMEVREDGKKYCTNSNWTYCYITNDTFFCGSCAKNLNYKCPVCGGTIKKDRSR